MLADEPRFRILVADDHPLVRQGVKAVLTQNGSYDVVGEAENAKEALALAQSRAPDLIVLDLEMPGMSGIELAPLLLEARPRLKILFLTSHKDEDTLHLARRVPFAGYMLKDEAPENLLEAVRTIRNGAVWLSQSIAMKMLGLDKATDKVQLSDRETQILILIAKGVDNLTISQTMSLADQTIRNYATAIFKKIGVTSRVEAAVWALERGLTAR